MLRRTDGGAETARGPQPRRRRRLRRPVIAVGLMAVGVVALVALVPSMSGVCGATGAGGRVARAVDAGSTVLIVGDSYTVGRGSSDQEHGWAQMLTASEAWRSTIDGIPGTGYTNGAGGNPAQDTYLPRIAAHAALDPDLVLVQGSQNDWNVAADVLERRVQATLRLAERLWPDAVVVAIGPSAPRPRADTTAGIDAAVAAGARSAHVAYVDPNAEGWFTTRNSPAYAAHDGEHLDDAGYHYMADRVRAALQALAADDATCRAN
ncbi:SGNH/GDSL hydrolase family protein [Microbacterium sp. M1A1_1b]